MSPDLGQVFDELMRSQGPRLRRLAGSYARGGDAADLLQEILLQIWRSLPSYRGEAALETWAFRIGLNTAFSHLRLELKRRAAVDADGAAAEAAPGVPDGTAEQARILDDFLGSLGPVDRAVMLAYLEGLSHEQIAEVMGSSLGAIAVRISRLKAAYKRRYLGG